MNAEQRFGGIFASETHRNSVDGRRLPRHSLSKSLSLPETDFQFKIECCQNEEVGYYNRQRSNSLPSSMGAVNRRSTSEKKLLAVMTNLAHIIIGIAITQLGIVGTWYQRYMNFPKDQLRHVIYVCVLYIVLGIYGICVVRKNLGRIKAHRYVYMALSYISVTASCFIIANGIRIVISEHYRTSETVIIVFDALMICLAGAEIPFIVGALYVTVPKPSSLQRNLSINELIDGEASIGTTSPPSWGSIFSIILNIAHIVLGLCITELAMVGMMYRNIMNIEGTGLFAVMFVSLVFISVGMMGIYNQLTGKASFTCNRTIYTCASLLAAGCATTIMSFVSIAMAGSEYYSGIEAIVAFDVMILSMSGIELIVALAATALCLVPLCLSRLRAKRSVSS